MNQPDASASARDAIPTTAEETVYKDRDHIQWVCQQLYDQIKSKWTQIEGVHQRATYILTVLLGIAAFTAATIKPFDETKTLWFAISLGIPLAVGVLFVLMPRIGKEHDVLDLWDRPTEPPRLKLNEPKENLDMLADTLLDVAELRDKELDSKGRWLVLTQVLALLGIIGMLVLIATGGHHAEADTPGTQGSHSQPAGGRAPASPGRQAPPGGAEANR